MTLLKLFIKLPLLYKYQILQAIAVFFVSTKLNKSNDLKFN